MRFVRREVEDAQVKNGALENVDRVDSLGFGVRAIADGAWGFAASPVVTGAEADRVAALAVEVARASALTKRDAARLAPVQPVTATWRSPVAKDPFAMSFDDRLALLLRADAAMRAQQPKLRTTRAAYEIWRESKLFLSSEGADIAQTITETGCSISAESVGDGEQQVRSYPASGGRSQGQFGWEFAERWDLVGNAPRIADEAMALLTRYDWPGNVRQLENALFRAVVLADGDEITVAEFPQIAAQVQGFDVRIPPAPAFGSLRYGSEAVSMRIDSTTPGGLGTFAYDDEGVPASEGWAVKDGLFVGYLMSRETAAALGKASNGTMRADGWARLPLIRMTNVSLMPGAAGTLADLVADTDEGIYMDTNRSWSIDDRRFNFQFGTQIGWLIKGGKLTEMVRNPTYTGITPEFWGSCDAVCSDSEWFIWGTPNCGKGQPSQVGHTGHGAAPARFRNVRVGVIRA